ncbi:MAG: DNA/RNA non-specific endonuclease [Chitinophagaceae bacterium]
MRKITLLSLFFSLVLLASCKRDVPDNNNNTNPTTPSTADNDHILPGNPSNAQTNATYTTNYLRDYVYYKISYNSAMGTPNWVAWHLQSDDLGSTPRQDDFRADDLLPTAWYKVTTTSYSGSGFDRGHNCPSADRTSSVAANSSTFYMTNMIPQAPTLNQGPWEGLEDFIRNTLVGTANEAWIFMGAYGNAGGYGSNGEFTFIDNGRVRVPSKVWKVVLVLPKGNGDLNRMTSTATVLCVSMPNDNRLYTTSNKSAWRNYLISVSALEIESNANGTPLNLFSSINSTDREALKGKIYQ